MLYLADKKAKLFKGDYKPVSLYLGNEKAAGYEYAEQTGEYLTFENTYNDSAYLKIFGKTVEVGEGEKSPDNPYELKSVGDDGGFDLVSAGRNLIPPFTNDYTVTIQGVTMSVLKGGQSVKVDGEFTGSFPEGRIVLRSVAGRIKLEGGVTYTFSAYHVGGSYSRVSAYLNKVSDNTFIASTNFKGTGVQITPSEDTECYIGVVLSVDAKCEDAEFVFQIERGISTSPYTPFRGMQTVHIPYTLRSLPDGTCDYIEIDDVAKTLYRNVGEHIFTGDESIGYRSDIGSLDGYSRFTFPVSGRVAGNDAILCSHFSPISSYTVQSNGLRNISAWIEFQIENSTIGAVDGDEVADLINKFKSLLAAQYAAGTPVTVQYKPANPPEPIELDYNEIKTFYPYTQIYTAAEIRPLLEGRVRVWD